MSKRPRRSPAPTGPESSGTAAGPAVPSPCVKKCRLNQAAGLCSGCLRTVGEIARWGDADSAERGRILAAVAERRARHGARRDEEP